MSCQSSTTLRCQPVRENLAVCTICGQIFDIDHMGEVFHHRHEEGDDAPLPPDTRGQPGP